MTLRKLNCDTIQFHEYKCLNIFIWMFSYIYSWNKNHNTQTFLAILVSWVWVSALIRFSYSGWRVVVFCSGTADGWHWSNSDGTEGGDRDQGDTGHWTVSLQSHRWEHLTITNIVCKSSWSWAARVAETLSRTSAATVRTGSWSPPGTPRSPPPSLWRSLTRLDAEMGKSKINMKSKLKV